ncbi:MAG: hypothetical protein BECKG1743D_GA0114223_100069 [Candidatus Kentron sp. G]|nr:MAG: hypothetical protein BECKG1743D_GA0114223_100069 [Candidatus Kentron sp. G]
MILLFFSLEKVLWVCIVNDYSSAERPMAKVRLAMPRIANSLDYIIHIYQRIAANYRASHSWLGVLEACRAYGDRSEKMRNRGQFFANLEANSELERKITFAYTCYYKFFYKWGLATARDFFTTSETINLEKLHVRSATDEKITQLTC